MKFHVFECFPRWIFLLSKMSLFFQIFHGILYVHVLPKFPKEKKIIIHQFLKMTKKKNKTRNNPEWWIDANLYNIFPFFKKYIYIIYIYIDLHIKYKYIYIYGICNISK